MTDIIAMDDTTRRNLMLDFMENRLKEARSQYKTLLASVVHDLKNETGAAHVLVWNAEKLMEANLNAVHNRAVLDMAQSCETTLQIKDLIERLKFEVVDESTDTSSSTSVLRNLEMSLQHRCKARAVMNLRKAFHAYEYDPPTS